MLTAETTLRIDRPSRYLVQLCKHAAAMGEAGGGHRPRPHTAGAALARGDLRVHAEHSDTHGVVTIEPWGKATLEATADQLTVRVDAADHDALQQIQGIITRDLERFGRRDRLTVAWPPPRRSDAEAISTEPTTEPTTEPAQPAQPATGPAQPAKRSRRTTIVLIALVVAAVAVHLGLGGTVLAKSRWTSLSIDLVLSIVAIKLLLVVFGGRALRRRHFPHAGGHAHMRARHHAPSRGASATDAALDGDHRGNT